MPLFVLWFGIFEGSKITLIAVGVFFPVYLGVMGAIMSVDRKLVEVGRAFRLSRRGHGAAHPAARGAAGLCASSLRSGLGLGWMFVVAAELLGASEGLGYLLIDGQQLGKPAQIVAAIVAFAIIGKTTDWIIVAAAAPFLRWEDAFARARMALTCSIARTRRQDLSERRARARRRHARRGSRARSSR